MDDDLIMYFAPFIVRERAPVVINNRKTPLRIIVLQKNALKSAIHHVDLMKKSDRKTKFEPITE